MPKARVRGARDRGISVLRDRWVGLAAGLLLECFAGHAYLFGLYSQHLKERLGYSQRQVDVVGLAKDLGGNVGILAGLAGDSWPPWAVLALGAAMNAAGYLGTWAVLTGRVGPTPFPLLLVLVCVGTNGATFFNTAALVTGVKNFPGSRGPVVGLLKGFVGLSGAFFTQLYLALHEPDQDSFLLTSAWLPALVAIAVAPCIHALPALAPTAQAEERSSLLLVLCCSVGAALVLLLATLLDEFLSVSRLLSLAVAGLVLLAPLSPLAVLWCSREGGTGAGTLPRGDAPCDMAGGDVGSVKETGEEHIGSCQVSGGGGVLRTASSSSLPKDAALRQRLQALPAGSASVDEEAALLSPEGAEGKTPLWSLENNNSSSSSSTAIRGSSLMDPGKAQGLATLRSASKEKEARSALVAVGENHSLAQAACTASFWLLFSSLALGSGTGLTAINNLGQYTQALGFEEKEVAIFVSLVSIWNFLGRVAAGYISEALLHSTGLARPVFMAHSQLLMAVGNLALASAAPAGAYVGSVIVGLCFGAQWGLMPTIACEIFGLEHFGTLYNWLTITNPVGSYLLSVCIAGYLYDREAAKEAAQRLSQGLGVARDCHGAHCFRETFLLMAVACMTAALLSYALASRTKKFYDAEHSARKAFVTRRGDFREEVEPQQ